MSTDEAVTKDLIETLEDGKEGFSKAADKLDGSDSPELGTLFREYSDQRATFSAELREMAKDYGDQIHESGSVAATLHRGWMTLKDAVAGTDPEGVLDAAAMGEDHAIKEYDKALAADISAGLRTVVQRQATEVKAAHDKVRALRDAKK